LLFEVSDEGKWVDSVYNAMTFDEKSGAVIYGCCLPNKDDAHYDAIEKLITENKIEDSRRIFSTSG
jgi:hypothetical protein